MSPFLFALQLLIWNLQLKLHGHDMVLQFQYVAISGAIYLIRFLILLHIAFVWVCTIPTPYSNDCKRIISSFAFSVCAIPTPYSNSTICASSVYLLCIFCVLFVINNRNKISLKRYGRLVNNKKKTN